ncbi:VOC family protein [Dactylosporangium sp. NPDC050588]|uniref:VOC family protein n=1 Tax=Dactylosporangium sp. NPDC050588 TaxID=3157211 RepID=UPI0033D86A67
MTGFATLIMVNIDCAEPPVLAEFYSEMLGWEVTHTQAEYAMVSDGKTSIGFGQIGSYEKPTWPEGPVPKQFHLDFYVDDLADAEERAVKLGATRAEFQPAPERYLVLVDPAGHPFCACLRS